ncbi:MAG: hypothetical protein KUG52_05470 [Immundisolibacteraceae bacterium]|nr:hypothetical protein [Immundisolibacteraceae bacterium]
MRKYFVGLLLGTALFSTVLQAAYIDYDGTVEAATPTNFGFVLGSTMWGSVEQGGGTGTASDGFSSLAGLVLSKFSFTFGDLELTDHLSPTATAAGFEYYSEGDNSIQPMQFFYDGDLWANATLNFLQVDVTNINDADATGSGTANLTSAGVDSAFFNEVMALTSGSGLLTFDIYNFKPVDSGGNFQSAGRISVPSASVPEPTFLLLTGPALLGLFGLRRKQST